MADFASGTAEIAGIATSFGIVALAELGDKSQLVCMTLASRHRGWPVLAGAVAAFGVLNLIAVLFGAAAAEWLPQQVLAVIVGVLFLVFGVQSLRAGAEEEGADEVAEPASGRSLVLTTFVLIFMAEFGDKTQLAVAGLGSAAPPEGVWLGATAALAMTSALGIWVGRTLLQRPLVWLHRAAGLLFLVLAAAAFWSAWSS